MDKIPFGRVVLDATPVEIPTRLRLPASRAEQIREFVRHEISRQAVEQGLESFEEADDFVIDEQEPLTPYELAMLDGEIQPIVDRIIAARSGPAVGGAPSANASPLSPATSPVADGVVS